mmetsp:Transcript_29449/g.59738  ORF Transcript_29449/g.59738 Transcript_29449/m.59738 type:complete len:88 (+) Transcript_29449:1954-2217(+)
MGCRAMSLTWPRMRAYIRGSDYGLRPALDAGSPDILLVSLAQYNGEICIIVDHKMMPSMRTTVYSTSSAVIYSSRLYCGIMQLQGWV